jgi:hypothetical protein
LSFPDAATLTRPLLLLDNGKAELRPVWYTLEWVLGSNEALPNTSADLEREIELATAEAADRIVRRTNP